MNLKKITLITSAIVVIATSVQAQRLLSAADSLRSHFYVEQCCAMTLELCAARKPECQIAPRLLRFLAWTDSVRKSEPSALPAAMQSRYTSFTDPRRPALDFNNWPVSGDAKAPVTVWVYFSGTCPSCKRNFKELHTAMTSGTLKGKAKMISKPLHASDVNILLAAASEMGTFADIMLDLAERQGRVDSTLIYSIAQSRMMDVNRLRTLANSPAAKKRVEAAEEESKKENVRYVPTYYINGRRYDSHLDPMWVIDAIEYEFEAVKKK